MIFPFAEIEDNKMLFKLVLNGMKTGKARVACAVAGVAAAVGALVFTSSLAQTNAAQAPQAAEKAAAPFVAWKVDSIHFPQRRGAAKAPLSDRKEVKAKDKGIPRGAALSLRALPLTVDLRPGGHVMQGPPVRVLFASAPRSNPYHNVTLEEGRWVDENSSQAEVVCVKKVLQRSGKGEVPKVGDEVKFVGAKGTMSAKVVGYLSGGRLPREFPTVFANKKAFELVGEESIGRVSFFRELPSDGDYLTPQSQTVVESFKDDGQRHMDYVRPLMIIAAFLTALSLLVNSLRLSVEANKVELAKLRAIGLTRKGLVLFAMLESSFSAFIGWAVGVTVSLLALFAYVSLSSEYFFSMAIDVKRIVISFALLPVVTFLSVLFSLSPVLRVRGMDAASSRKHSARRGMVIAYACGFAAFIAVEVWGASLMRAFVPSRQWPDAIVSLLPGGVSSYEVDALRKAEGVKRVSELVPRQLNLSLPSAGERPRNVLFLAAEYLPSFTFEEGDWKSASEAIFSGRGVVVDLMLSRAYDLHLGGELSVLKKSRRGGKEETLKFPIVGVVDVNWHMVTSRGLVRGLKGASPMTDGPVFCSLDTMGEIDPSTFMADPALSAPMTHLWVDYKEDFLAKHGVFGAGRLVEKEIVRLLGNPTQATVRLHARDEIADGTLARGTNVIGQVARVPFVFLAVLAIGFIAMLVAETDARRQEFAVLRAVGATSLQIGVRLISSALKTAIWGIVFGLPIGAFVGWYFAGITSAHWPGMPHYFVIPWSLAAEGAVGAVVFALLFAIPTSLFLVRSRRGKGSSDSNAKTGRSKGALAITASALGFAVMAACVRLSDDFGGEVSSFQKSFFRNIVAFFVALCVFMRAKSDGKTQIGAKIRHLFQNPRAAFILVLRSVLGTCGIFANFYALGKVSIAECQTLNKTAPFFTVLFAWMFLGEKASARRIWALLVALLGVMFVAKPAFAGADAFPLTIALLGGAFAGGAYAAVRALGRMEVDSSLIVLFFSGFSTLASIPFMVQSFDPMTIMQVVILLGAGVAAAAGQFGLTIAYRCAAPKDIAVYDYSNILFTATLGFLLFGQIPDMFSVAGFVFILAAAFILHPCKYISSH